MIFKRFEIKILLMTLALATALAFSAFFLVNQKYVYACLALPFAVYYIVVFYKLQTKAHKEMRQFVEAIRYRDFSHHYNEKNGPPEIQALYSGFNEVNASFKTISKEKETQYQYLQNILELVGAGILSYNMDDGTVAWMNESLKQLLRIPYLKNISSLEKRQRQLTQQVLDLKPGGNTIATIDREMDTRKILLTATAFQTPDGSYKLIAFQDANEALDETEANAWHKLLRVMTHEIMNSVAPISSLAETLKNRLEIAAPNLNDGTGAVEDMKTGIETIQKRSAGLLKFAETYRNLNKITSIDRSEVYARDLFENIYQLMEPTLQQKNVELDIVLKDPDIKIFMDKALVEQALINLVLNAIEAVKDKAAPRIVLSAFMTEVNKPMIKVADNGQGIDKELIDEIFIPFFSTRKNGSGIGLSLCRQIMLLHKGSIQVHSDKGVGTVFMLQF